MCRSMVDIQSASAEIRRGIKKKKIEERRKKIQGKNIMSASAMQGGHNNYFFYHTVNYNGVTTFKIVTSYIF